MRIGMVIGGALSFFALALSFPVSGASAATTNPYPVSTEFAAPGTYATTSMMVTTNGDTYDVFRPSSYRSLGFKSPIITWGNGTNATPGMYSTLLSHFASYGFTVIASTLTNTGSGREIAGGVRFLVAANAAAGNTFTRHLNVHEVAAVGHSQGATGAVRVATMDSRLISSVMTFSLPNVKWSFPNSDCPVKADCEANPRRLTQPIFFISTHGPIDSIIASPATERADFHSVAGRAVLGIIAVSGDHLADHNSDQDTAFGGSPEGELGYSTAWLEYTLRGDRRAAPAFTGSHPEIMSNADWPGSQVKK